MALAVRESGKSLQEIADIAGTSKGQVSQWQTEGKVQHEMVKAHVVESICAALLIRPRLLLYGEEPMRPDADDTPPAPSRCLRRLGTMFASSNWTRSREWVTRASMTTTPR